MWENEEVVCSRKSEIFFVSAATAADPICDREREREIRCCYYYYYLNCGVISDN